ncbi:hypothetical protein CKF54_00340 [Psittacicella hinzii]|uniref:Uncharacterized protein n=1 Tax=Psittacicella hinzii TaxID=2028575 RepID=A0A3A1YBD4_9GAMM|nr:hypothetical protein [Psittacicella hinzii]RIY34478.1 hypothetical protein CKF54_00340 [Psittacicella hinzii]
METNDWVDFGLNEFAELGNEMILAIFLEHVEEVYEPKNGEFMINWINVFHKLAYEHTVGRYPEVQQELPYPEVAYPFVGTTHPFSLDCFEDNAYRFYDYLVNGDYDRTLVINGKEVHFVVGNEHLHFYEDK